jgi:hypothetical protein
LPFYKQLIDIFFRQKVSTAHYNERSTQIQTVRKIFFTDYEWSLAANVLSDKQKVVTHDDTTTAHKPMQVCDVMVEDGLKSIDALRAALLSADFYKYRNLYHCFCSGIESGILRGTEETQEIHRLEALLSVGAETHIRNELWYTLSEYGFSHNIGKDHRDSRLKTFHVMSDAVREGRKKYGDKAWQKRQDDMESESDDGENGEDVDEIEYPDGTVLKEDDPNRW